MEGTVFIERMISSDWPSVAQIYKQGIETGRATFEKEVPDWDSWNKSHIASCRLVAKREGNIVGWAALSPVSSRCVYGGVAEVSIYVEVNCRGDKIGEKLLLKLISESEKEGFWTLQSGMFPDNIPSIKIHEKAGFRKIGIRERIGQLDGVWKDNIVMEKRSKIIG